MSLSRLRVGVWALCPFLALTACEDKTVVAQVGKTEVRRADLETFSAARARALPDAQALDALVERELLAEGAKRSGLDKDEKVRARVAANTREILAQALLDEVAVDATTDANLRALYTEKKDALTKKEIHIAHIVVRFDSRGGDKARLAAESKLNGLYARATAGEAFETLAKEASEDSATASRGGDLGLLRDGQVDATFFAHGAALKKGEVSKPFQTPFGMHLVKALDDPKSVTPSYEEAKSQLQAEARAAAGVKVLEQLKRDVRVKRFPDHLPQLKTSLAEKVEIR